ncbi:unnamed protein product [Heligmosomoides polygyrus]|uniref:Reverse transcriptase domain-containing protein n=1 Tax=Heligmosomoides polygyrus TaxID=6339 RepID=A0A183FTD0_HELPZ|nr:unnamed protein product [Heligmosomoides polygyrus]
MTEEDIQALLETILKCNIFQFDGVFYAQKCGLVIGLRIAPLLAIVYMDRIGRRSLTQGIVFYKRYLDDVFVIGSTALDLDTTLDNLNSCDPNIQFTVESPDQNGFLPFLNTEVCTCHGRKEFVWYKKPASQSVLLHSRSAHPLYMKVNVISHLVASKDKTCTEESMDAEANISRILEENGYTRAEARSWRPHFIPGGVPLVFPYVNERIATEVNRVVKASGLPVKLVFRPPPNLKSLLTASRICEEKCGRNNCPYCTTHKICQLRGTVYQVTCEGWGEKTPGRASASVAKPRFLPYEQLFATPHPPPHS